MTLADFAALVRDMRAHQRAYFVTRSTDELRASKVAERAVDGALAEIQREASGIRQETIAGVMP